jgi:hypothetical protein
MRKPGNFDDRERAMEPPGWIVEMPDGWVSRVSTPLPPPLGEPWVSHVAAGRVLYFEAQNQEILWPVVTSQVNGEIQPVAGLDAVINAIKHVPVPLTIECIVVRLDSDGEHREFLDPVRVPADTAHELGFIDRETHDKLGAEVRIATRREMKAAIEALPADEHYVRDKHPLLGMR